MKFQLFLSNQPQLVCSINLQYYCSILTTLGNRKKAPFCPQASFSSLHNLLRAPLTNSSSSFALYWKQLGAVCTLLPGMSSSKYDVKLKLTPDIPLNKKLRSMTSSLGLCNMCAIYRPEMKRRPDISPQGASLLFRSKFVRCIDITK